MATKDLSIAQTQKLFVQKITERFNLNLLGLKKAFSNYDKDQNGLLDLEEVKKCMGQFLTSISEDSVANLVDLYDTNGDGMISYEEFLTVLRNPKMLNELHESAMEKLPDANVVGDDEELTMSEALSDVMPPPPPAARHQSRRARAAAQQPVSDRQSSIFSFDDDAAESYLETEIDLKDSVELEKRSRSYLYNVKQLLCKQAQDLRTGGKVGGIRERLIVSSSELLDNTARGLMMKAFESYLGSGGRGSSTIELGDFSKVLRTFNLPGSSSVRPEVIYFIFHLCKREDDNTAAHLDLFETLVFGAPVGSPKRASGAANKSPRSPSKMVAAGVSAARGEDGSWFGDDDNDDYVDPQGLGGMSLVDNATKDHPTVQKGPYKRASKKRNDPIDVPKRFISRRSRTSYPVPASFDPTMQERSSKKPTQDLEQAHMLGMSCALNSGSNIISLPAAVADPGNPTGTKNDPDFLDSSVVIYAAGSTGVIHDLSTNTQSHFRGHSHEITCIAMSHCGNLIATGCNGGSKSVIHVWESKNEHQDNPQSLARMGEGFFDRAVCAVSFCCDANYVAGIGCDDGHRLGIWDIRNPGVYLVDARCQAGIPPQIKDMQWAPQQQYTEYISTQNRGLCEVLCTVGDHHIKLWSFKKPVSNSLGTQENAVILGRSCILGPLSKQVSAPKTYTCCGFVQNTDGSSDTVVGGSNGIVYLFKKNICSAFANAIRGGVSCLRVEGDVIVVGGANGVVKVLNSRTLGITMGFSTNVAAVPGSVGSVGQEVSLRPSSRGAVNAVSRSPFATGGGDIAGAGGDAPAIMGITVLKSARGTKYAIASSNSGRAIKIDFSKFSARPSSAAGKQKEAPSGPSPGVSSLFHYHTGEMWGLTVGTVRSRAGHKHSYIATTADDRRLSIWNPSRRCLVARTTLPSASHCCSFDPSCKYICVGTQDGAVQVYQVKPGGKQATTGRSGGRAGPALKGDVMSSATREKQEEAREREKKTYLLEPCAGGYRKDFKEAVSDVKFSPDGSMLAAGSNDDTICIYSVTYPQTEGETMTVRPLHRLKGHSSYITHIDWSADGTMIRSTCGAYELLYWEAARGLQYTAGPSELSWHTESCPLGFPVMGIWPAFSDGTDINAVDALTHGKSDSSKLVVTGDDNALVNLMNYPCVVKHAPRKSYNGHGAHVTNINFFLQGDGTTGVVSTGGRDASIILWDITMPQAAPKRTRRYEEELF